MNRVVKKTKENETQGSVFEVHCSDCSRCTRHKVLQSVEKTTSDFADHHFVDSVDWVDHFQVIECQGCEATSFRHTHWFSEADGTGERLYPQRSESTAATKDLWNVPTRLRRLYRETIDAYNFEALTLCAAGLRAIVEGICAEKDVVDGPVTYRAKDGELKTSRSKNLVGKISGMAEKRILSERNAEILNEHRFLGNDAVHELSPPSSSELLLAVQIVEHTLEALFEIPETAAELRSKRERRRKKDKR